MRVHLIEQVAEKWSGPPGNGRSSDPGDKPDDHENANGHEGGERTRHPNPHRNLNETEIVVHAGGLILYARRSAASDPSGSETTLVSMKSHFGHSKVRFSERSARGAMLVRFIRVRHLAHSSRSIGECITSVSERGMLLTS
jgi:hypothetical protein